MARRGLNKAMIIGNLGQDPDTRYSGSGSAVVNLNIATDESYKDRQTGQLVPQTEWHRAVLFGKVAEVAAQYLRKGSKVYIEGRLETRKWQPQDGSPERSVTKIIVDIDGQMQMLDSAPGDNQASSGQGERSAPPAGRGYQRHSQGAQGGPDNGYQGDTGGGAYGGHPTSHEEDDGKWDDIPF